MITLRTDALIFALSIVVMLAVRFWASLAGAELFGVVTLLRIVVGGAIRGGVVAVWTPRVRSGIALGLGVSIATIIASVFTRGGIDPEAAVGAALIAVAVSLGSYVVIRRIVTWVSERGRVTQALLAIVGVLVSVGLIIAVATAP